MDAYAQKRERLLTSSRPMPDFEVVGSQGPWLHLVGGTRIFDGSSGLLCTNVGQSSAKVHDRIERHDANRWIAPVLGLPELPFVGFGDVLLQERPDGVHWKTGPLVDYASGRPFAWVDDEQSELDQTYVTAHHPGPGLLHHVNPRIGLRENDFHTLADFARSLDTSRTTG